MSGTVFDSRGGRQTAHRALAAALALVLAGCSSMPGAAPPAAAPPAPATNLPPPSAPAAPVAATTPKFPDPVSAPWIAARIGELEAARGRAQNADPDGALALELALLYSHPGNPAPDHVEALAMMRAYLAVAPPEARDPLIAHVAGLLENIDRQGRIVRDSRERENELASQLQSLEKRVAEGEQREAAAKKREQELLAQIKTLQQQIDQIQKLDLEIERRRRSVR